MISFEEKIFQQKYFPLTKEAFSILSLVSKISLSIHRIEIKKLHSHFKKLLTLFEKNSKSKQEIKTIKKASYILATTIDEIVLNTPWGENSKWNQKPMLSIFHQETYGGEKFYALLNNEINKPVKNYPLIKLLYLCLSLGFMGKLRIQKDGKAIIEKIRHQLYQLLKKMAIH